MTPYDQHSDPEGTLSFNPDNPPVRVVKWIARLQRTLDAAPPGLWLYIASGSPLVMVQTKDGDRLRLDDGITFDQRAVIDSLTTRRLEMDGGDF